MNWTEFRSSKLNTATARMFTPILAFLKRPESSFNLAHSASGGLHHPCSFFFYGPAAWVLLALQGEKNCPAT